MSGNANPPIHTYEKILTRGNYNTWLGNINRPDNTYNTWSEIDRYL